MKLADSLNPATQAENIKKLNAGLEAVDAKTLPGTSTATTGQILKLTGENKTPSWADEYSYTPPAYSETEVKTGQKWIDGKDVYMKVFSGNLGAEVGSYTISNSENIGSLITFIGVVKNNTSDTYFDINRQMSITFTASTITIGVTTYYTGSPYNLIAYYTKPDPVPETRDDTTEPEEPETKKTTKKKATK